MTASQRTFAFALVVLAVASSSSIALQIPDEHHAASLRPVKQGSLGVGPSSNASGSMARPVNARSDHGGSIAVLDPSIAIVDEHKKVVGKLPHAPAKSESPSTLQERGVAFEDVGVDVHPANGLGGKHVDVDPHAHIEGGMPTPNPAPAYVPKDIVSKPVSRTSEILSLAKNATSPVAAKAPVHMLAERDIIAAQDKTNLQPTKMPLAVSPGGRLSVGADKPVLQRRQDDGSGDDFDPADDPYNVAGGSDGSDGGDDGDELAEADPFENDWRRRQEESSDGLLPGSDDGDEDGAGVLGNDGPEGDSGDDANDEDDKSIDAQSVDGPTSTLLPDPSSGPADSSSDPSDMGSAGDDGMDGSDGSDLLDVVEKRRIDSRWFKPVYYGSNSKKLASRLVNVLSNNNGSSKAVPKPVKENVKCIDYVHLSDRRACEKLQDHLHYDGAGKKVHEAPQDIGRRDEEPVADVGDESILPVDDGGDSSDVVKQEQELHRLHFDSADIDGLE